MTRRREFPDPLARVSERLELVRLRTAGADRDGLALLASDTSMTRSMAERFGPVTVSLLREGIGVAAPDEARRLGLRTGRGGCWRREILLIAGGRPRLQGRTIVAADAPRLRRALERLGTQPLMNLLFRDGRLRPDVIRGQRRFGRWRDKRLYRQTLYLIDSERLLLTETLLPLG